MISLSVTRSHYLACVSVNGDHLVDVGVERGHGDPGGFIAAHIIASVGREVARAAAAEPLRRKAL